MAHPYHHALASVKKWGGEETLSLRAAYETAVKTRVMRERAERHKNRTYCVRRGRLSG